MPVGPSGATNYGTPHIITTCVVHCLCCCTMWLHLTACATSFLFFHLLQREDYQNCSVLYCVLKLYTVISTVRWAVLTVHWIGFCCTRPILLYVDLFVFICVYFVCFCFILHSFIIVSTVGSTWWEWSVILRTYLPSVLWHCWLGHLTCKNLSPMWPIMCLVGL